MALGIFLGDSVLGQNALIIPPTLTGPEYNLNLQVGSTSFQQGQTTTTYGYNGAYLGPTLIMNQGDFVSLNVINNLPEVTTTHWHGMHVAPEHDGGPHTAIDVGGTWSIGFKVYDSAATMWYHPHLHEHTANHVNHGAAGMLLIRDDVETAAGLPINYGVDEFPLVLQDREFRRNGDFNITPLGDVMMVNGTLDPYLEVPSQMVRFRVLNGSNERVYHLGLSDSRSFSVIGADGGLLEAPAPVTRVTLMTGERVDIVINFGADTGSTLDLVSYSSELAQTIPGSAGGPGGNNALNGVDIKLVEFRVGTATPEAVTSLPTHIWTLDRFDENEATVTRRIQLTGGGPGNPFTIDNQSFDGGRIDQTVLLDNVEIWEIENRTRIAHPFHIHDIQFYILDRNGQPPPAREAGKKDTVMVNENETVRFITKFDHFANHEIPYMYHCHILPHEDDGMMGQFIVADPSAQLIDLSLNGSNLSLSWHGTLDAFTLQSSVDLKTFVDVATVPTELDGIKSLVLPIDTSFRFFRMVPE